MQSFKEFYTINESTRRNILKQITSAVLGSFVNADSSAVSVYDVTENLGDREFFEYLVMDLQGRFAKKRGIKSWGWPVKEQQRFEQQARNQIDNIMRGIIPKSETFLRSFAEYSSVKQVHDQIINSIEVGVQSLLREAPASEIKKITNYMFVDRMTKIGNNMRIFVPAKDIVVNGRVVIPADNFIKYGLGVSYKEAARNIATMSIDVLDIEQVRARIKSDDSALHQAQQKHTRRGINYSRFDTAGGNEDDDYKLALDSFKTPNQLYKIIK